MYNDYEDNQDSRLPEEQEELMTMSVVGKVVNTFVAPTKAMQAIRLKPTFWLAAFLMVLLPLLYYTIFWQAYEVATIKVLETQFAETGVELTREMLEFQLTIQRWATPIITLLTPLFVLLPALLYFGVGKVTKADIKFTTTFSMLLHASVIASMVWGVHMIAVMLTGESDLVLPLTSVATLVSPELVGNLMYAVLSGVEIFSIWYYVVLYLGLQHACGYSKRAAAITLAVTIMINIGIVLASAASTGMLGGA